MIRKNNYKYVVLATIALLWLLPTRQPITKVDGLIRYEGVLLIVVFCLLFSKLAINKNYKIQIYHDKSDKIMYLMIVFSFIAFIINPALPSFSDRGVSGFGFWFSLFLGYVWYFTIRYFLRSRKGRRIKRRTIPISSCRMERACSIIPTVRPCR